MQIRIYTPQRKESLLTIAKGVLFGFIEGRELAWQLFLRDLKASYTKSILGITWVFLPPITTAALWIFLNAQHIVTIQNSPMTYAAFAVCGTMFWSLFAEATTKPIQRYQSAMGLMAKLNFPREAIALASIYDLAFSFMVKIALLIPLLWILGYPPTLNFLPGLLFAFLLTMLGFSIGLFLSPLGLLYSDVVRGFTMALPFLMYLSPVIYPVRKEGHLAWLQPLNPVTPFLERARSLIGGYEFLMNTELIYFSILMVMVMVIGQIALRIALPVIIERSGS